MASPLVAALASRLAEVDDRQGLTARHLAPNMPGRQAGAILRRLRESGYATQIGHTAPTRWAPTATLHAAVLRRSAAAVRAAVATIGQPPQLALPCPPGMQSPERFEQLGRFVQLRDRLSFFVGRYWLTNLSSGVDGHDLYLEDYAVSVVSERLTEPVATRPDAYLLVSFDAGATLCLSRRSFTGAVYDRALQALTIRHRGMQVTIEFVPDGMDGPISPAAR